MFNKPPCADEILRKKCLYPSQSSRARGFTLIGIQGISGVFQRYTIRPWFQERKSTARASLRHD